MIYYENDQKLLHDRPYVVLSKSVEKTIFVVHVWELKYFYTN